VEASEERACSVKTVVAEFAEALSIEEALSAHFQGVERKDRGSSYVGVFGLRDRRFDSSEVSFQALSVIELVVLGQETPCLLFEVRKSGIGSDW
jgi:hypothetical protein